MNKSCAISFVIDPLEVDDEVTVAALREGKYLSTKQRHDMIRYHRCRFSLKVSVIDAELSVEPGDLACN